MKNILIVSHSMVCGGVEKSLLSLLTALEDHSVDLVLTQRTGSLLESVPDDVAVKEVPFSADGRYEWEHGSKKYLVALLVSFRWLRALRLVLFHSLFLKCFVPRGRRKDRWFMDLLVPHATKHWPTYDVAIAFGDTPEIVALVADRVKAERKIGWIHNDHPISIFDRVAFAGVYKVYDCIGACSAELARSLSELFAPCGMEVVHFPHIIEREAYELLAREAQPIDPTESAITIVSVGRVCGQKGFDIAINVCARLLKKGIALQWYVVGDGVDLAALKKEVQERGLGENFHFVGLQTNPYPYIKACDIYVQPSRYEGYCLTLAEARVLCKPIVTTDFIGAKEQIVHGKTGLVVNCDVDQLVDAVKQLALDEGMRDRFASNLQQESDSEDAKAVLLNLLLETDYEKPD